MHKKYTRKLCNKAKKIKRVDKIICRLYNAISHETRFKF